MRVPWEFDAFDICFVGDPDCENDAESDSHTEHCHVSEAIDLHELARTHQVELWRLTVVLEDLCVVVFWDEVSGANGKVMLPPQSYCC